MRKHLLMATAAALCLPRLAMAEAVLATNPTSGSTASAHVDVTVVIPAILSLRIGTGGGLNTTDGTIDSLVFTVPAANLGSGTPVAAGATDGDLGNGAVTVRVYSNIGTNVTLNSNVTGLLTSTGSDTIPWSQISVAAAALSATTSGFTNAAITHPGFNSGGSGGNGTATTLTAVSKMVRYEGQWTYAYANGNQYPAGTYGTNARNGRITYTVTQL